jgi:uncharacterized protein (DUF1015 family)
MKSTARSAERRAMPRAQKKTRCSVETALPIVQPFRALRPAPGRAQEVLAPPYDVLSSDEARARAAGKPWSFLHVSKAEIDLPGTTDAYDAKVYAKAADNLKRMISAGVLIREERPTYYVYRLTRQGREQTGVAGVFSVADYETGRIKRHELTTPVKEDDRVRQIEAVNAQTGPAMLAHPRALGLDALVAAATNGAPAVDVTADDQVRHRMWVVDDTGTVERITTAFEAMPALYIADGHHRTAAAARIAKTRPVKSAGYFLAVAFPANEMTILDYNRVLKDLNGETPTSLVRKLGERFRVTPATTPVMPRSAGEFGLYLDHRWYALTIRGDLIPASDPIGRLPISLLSNNAIEPLFGIKDQRRDKRIDFVGGARGLDGLSRRVDSGEMAAAFALYPTAMADLMAVADMGGIMPPKSTWFEPKLADGLVSHVLD